MSFSYIFKGVTHTDRSIDYMQNLGMNQEQIESVLRQRDFEYNIKCKQVRADRDKRISETDHMMLPDYPNKPNGLQEYRQALRDVPQQDGFPLDIVWPDELPDDEANEPTN